MPFSRESFSPQVAAPPIAVNDFRSLRELEGDSMEKKLLVANTAGIDVSSLMQVLTPYEEVAEQDEVWEVDLLFQQVSAQIAKELSGEGEAASGGAEAAPQAAG